MNKAGAFQNIRDGEYLEYKVPEKAEDHVVQNEMAGHRGQAPDVY